MNFEVIPNLQTPTTPEIIDLPQFLLAYKETLEKFLDFAYFRHDCIGLAANQCSIDGERFNVRAICIKDTTTKEGIIAIDPKIIQTKGFERYKVEGCLTWRNQTILAKRFPVVEVEFFDLDGVKQTITAKGFQAQVWQHEINHINGVEEEVIDIPTYSFQLKRSYPNGLGSQKVERNDPCPCGSEKKYKNCCAAFDQT